MITTTQRGNYRPYSEPRSIVKVNSTVVPFTSWTVGLNGYSAADTFDLTLPFRIVDHLKGQTDLVNSPEQETILLTQPDILVEIYSGFPSNGAIFNENDLTQLMYGYLDTIDFYFDSQGERVQIQGRNQVSPFMDTKTTEKFPNKTSSAIVSYFAQQQGLTAIVTPTYTLAGTYYSDDHTSLSTDINQWDLMNFLAVQEGFTLRVRGNTVYFGPRDSFLKTTSLPFTWGQNIKSAHLSRSPHASKDIKVEVITWSSSKKARMVATSTSTTSHAKRIAGTSNHQQWNEVYYIPGLTLEQAQRKADSILNQLSASELVGQLNVDGNENMDIDQPITLYGFGLGVSMEFWPTRINHNFDSQQGRYTLDLSISNLNLPTNPGGL